MDHKTFISEVRDFIDATNVAAELPDVTLRRCLSEAWFSDTLAWLLDPKADHKLGVRFVNEFLKRIAWNRCSSEIAHARSGSHLKWGKKGPGRAPSGLKLENSSVMREFYLSKEVKKRGGRGQRYCDLVLFDLDSGDSLFVVIENKLFTTNHPKQLEDYFEAVESKYRRAKVREYVYLTLRRSEPKKFADENTSRHKHWVQLSWLNDVLEILKKLDDQNAPNEFCHLMKLLNYLKDLARSLEAVSDEIDTTREVLIEGATDCLLDELERLGEGKPGNWRKDKSKSEGIVLSHSSKSKSKLYVEMLSNLTVTVQGRRKTSQEFEKILIPFGSNTKQIFNLLDMAARDVYHLHFRDPRRYLGAKRRLTKTVVLAREKHRDLLNFIHKYRFELQVLMALSSKFGKQPA
jgi:hypothetical protein